MNRKNDFWWYRLFEDIAILPLILAIFPIPLIFPIIIISLSFIHHENLPVTIFYFVWLLIGSGFIFYTEEKNL